MAFAQSEGKALLGPPHPSAAHFRNEEKKSRSGLRRSQEAKAGCPVLLAFSLNQRIPMGLELKEGLQDTLGYLRVLKGLLEKKITSVFHRSKRFGKPFWDRRTPVRLTFGTKRKRAAVGCGGPRKNFQDKTVFLRAFCLFSLTKKISSPLLRRPEEGRKRAALALAENRRASPSSSSLLPEVNCQCLQGGIPPLHPPRKKVKRLKGKS